MDLDDPESGGTVGRKKGKKAKKSTTKKQTEIVPTDQVLTNKTLDLDENLEQGLDLTIGETKHGEVISSRDPEPLPCDRGTERDIEIGAVESNSDHTIDKARIAELENQLAQAHTDNAQLDDKYKGLLGRVASIRTTLTDRLNKDAEELQQTKGMVEALEEQNKMIALEKEALESSLKQTLAEKKILSQEVQDLRHRFSVSQQNWSKEREEADIIRTKIMEDLDSSRKSAQDWEVLAMEESSVRRALEEQSRDIEDQYLSQKDTLEKEILIKSQQSTKISDLQKALHDIQQTRKEELRNIVESTQSQIETLTQERTTLQEKLMDFEVKYSSPMMWAHVGCTDTRVDTIFPPIGGSKEDVAL
ncbi:hypothetical protein H072_2799 [Dactylellina haptotyla CBS 200.50]|uniref:Uncharacterized protein n=1 Tax=Dactylellina haptotyla (strain CBS 200.50) TaxID=1284197 RepID=S8BUR8_DACHA|nr:hypothetical protein H072_2799 [Dactylellina haptotyla CBS 200.50]